MNLGRFRFTRSRFRLRLTTNRVRAVLGVRGRDLRDLGAVENFLLLLLRVNAPAASGCPVRFRDHARPQHHARPKLVLARTISVLTAASSETGLLSILQGKLEFPSRLRGVL